MELRMSLAMFVDRSFVDICSGKLYFYQKVMEYQILNRATLNPFYLFIHRHNYFPCYNICIILLWSVT